MYMDTHLSALEIKHATLEKSIDAEKCRPAPDTLKITELKREKLKLKEEILRYQRA